MSRPITYIGGPPAPTEAYDTTVPPAGTIPSEPLLSPAGTARGSTVAAVRCGSARPGGTRNRGAVAVAPMLCVRAAVECAAGVAVDLPGSSGQMWKPG